MNSRGNLLFMCVLLGSGGALAQTSGTISGFTRDPAGAFVPGVTITVTNERTGAARSTTSDERGFSAPFIPGNDAQGMPLSTEGNAGSRAPFLPGTYGTEGIYLDNSFTS